MNFRYYFALAIAGGLFSHSTVLAQPEPDELPTLRITADPFNPTMVQYGSPVSIVDKDELLLQTETTIAETIGNEPGVSTTYFGPGSSRPVIRGNAGTRVRMLKNGTGILDVSDVSEDHQVASNPLSAESIEILRGPETLLYGSSAIGGVVNVTDNTIPEFNIGKPVTGSADLRRGTGDAEFTGAGKLEGQAGNFNWHVDGFYQDTDDIDIPGFAESDAQRALEEAEEEEGEEHGHDEEEETRGKLENSFTRSKGFTAGGSYVWDRGFIGASVNGHLSRYGVPGHGHEEEEGHDEEEEHEEGEEEEAHEEGEEEGVAIELEQWRADIRGRVDVGEKGDTIESVKFKAALSNYDHVELEDGAVGTRFENDAAEARVELAHNLSDDLSGVFGMQLEVSDFSSVGDESFIPQTDKFAPAAFLFEEFSIDDFWTVQVGGRYEFVDLDADGFSGDTFHPFGVSTGVVWDPNGRNDYTVGLSGSYTQRAPAAVELYADGPHLARQIFEIGDSELDEEASYGGDLTIKKNTGLVTGSVNLFIQKYSDYINLAATGGEEDGLPVFVYENVRALFWGFETEATLHLHQLFDLWSHDIDLDGQIDFVRAKNRSDDDDLPRVPPLRSKVRLRYGWKDLIRASVEGVFVQEQNDTAALELPTDDYQMLNASLEYKVPVSEDYTLVFYARGTNLTDEEARVHASFLKDIAPLRGRSVLFGTRATF